MKQPQRALRTEESQMCSIYWTAFRYKAWFTSKHTDLHFGIELNSHQVSNDHPYLWTIDEIINTPTPNWGAISIQRCCYTSTWVPIIKIRQSHNCLIFIMEILMPKPHSLHRNRPCIFFHNVNVIIWKLHYPSRIFWPGLSLPSAWCGLQPFPCSGICLRTWQPTLPAWGTHCNALTQEGTDKMVEILQTTFSKSFSWMKIIVVWWKFNWILFLNVQSLICGKWVR